MKIATNTFKRRIAAGERVIGLWNSLCSPVAMEIIADAGFDWILVDTEHAPLDIANLPDILRAGAGGTASLVVRPAANDPVLLKRILDVGAQTVMIPFVQNVAEAESAVAACQYPPLGLRGVSAATRAGRYGRAKDHFERADGEICVLLQLETTEALSEADKIAALPGVDGIFIGPSDLAASMGHIGNPGHPDVQDAIARTFEVIEASGKPAGILAPAPDHAAKYIELGFSFVAVGTDIGLLVAGSDGLRKRYG